MILPHEGFPSVLLTLLPWWSRAGQALQSREAKFHETRSPGGSAFVILWEVIHCMILTTAENLIFLEVNYLSASEWPHPTPTFLFQGPFTICHSHPTKEQGAV